MAVPTAVCTSPGILFATPEHCICLACLRFCLCLGNATTLCAEQQTVALCCVCVRAYLWITASRVAECIGTGIGGTRTLLCEICSACTLIHGEQFCAVVCMYTAAFCPFSCALPGVGMDLEVQLALVCRCSHDSHLKRPQLEKVASQKRT